MVEDLIELLKKSIDMTNGSGIVEDIIEPAINFVKDNKDLLKNVGESVVSTAHYR